MIARAELKAAVAAVIGIGRSGRIDRIAKAVKHGHFISGRHRHPVGDALRNSREAELGTVYGNGYISSGGATALTLGSKAKAERRCVGNARCQEACIKAVGVLDCNRRPRDLRPSHCAERCAIANHRGKAKDRA